MKRRQWHDSTILLHNAEEIEVSNQREDDMKSGKKRERSSSSRGVVPVAHMYVYGVASRRNRKGARHVQAARRKPDRIRCPDQLIVNVYVFSEARVLLYPNSGSKIAVLLLHVYCTVLTVVHGILPKMIKYRELRKPCNQATRLS